MGEPLSLYVHIPFCTKKCGYCDFNSHAGQESLIPAYTEALVREARLWTSLLGAGRYSVETVFFGGGTPSLMPLDRLAAVFEALRDGFRLSPDAEITLEANPGTVDGPYLAGLRDLSVNRLSLGVQSLDDGELAFLERIHSAGEARRAYRDARRAGFDNVNLDLIFGLPGQRLAAWRRSLEGALALAPDHLSLYALTVEEGTPLARYVAQGRVPAPDADAQAEMYLWTEERLARAGYDHYEISNWACLPDRQARLPDGQARLSDGQARLPDGQARPDRRCRHNLSYWTNGQWLGLGAGAHSHLGPGAIPEAGGWGIRFADAASPNRYVELVGETWRRCAGQGPPDLDAMRQVTFREPAGEALATADTLILGLRLSEGVDVAALGRRSSAGGAHADELGPQRAAVEECVSLGLLERAPTNGTPAGRLRLTARGRLLANEVFLRLLPSTA